MRRGAASAVLLIFFFSGLSSLLYQIVWLKELSYTFGNTVQAAATLIAVFLAGLGIGSFLFSRILVRVSPLLLYAVLEALIGLYGSFAPYGFDRLDELYVWFYQSVSADPAAVSLMRVAAASMFLLVPTILMGGTLPILVRWWSRPGETTGQAVSRLYSANTFGATAGATGAAEAASAASAVVVGRAAGPADARTGAGAVDAGQAAAAAGTLVSTRASAGSRRARL
ncbi:MAG: hypothetical protein KY432_00200, partial [Acidobacteria bacterium]|nr:hypothetical protein [Acidobacteriota bacterium]